MSQAAPRGLPPVLYVPTAGAQANGETALDMRETKDGRLALLVYTALDRLVSCCGDEQPWTLMPTEALDAVNDAHPYDVILVDLAIPEQYRRRAGVR